MMDTATKTQSKGFAEEVWQPWFGIGEMPIHFVNKYVLIALRDTLQCCFSRGGRHLPG